MPIIFLTARTEISDYLNKTRIEAAREELTGTDKKNIGIAFDVGFEGLRTFNKVFLDIVGVTPSNYRKN